METIIIAAVLSLLAYYLGARHGRKVGEAVGAKAAGRALFTILVEGGIAEEQIFAAVDNTKAKLVKELEKYNERNGDR